MRELTAHQLQQLLHYEPATGIFRYRVSPPNSAIEPGDIAGTLNTEGYLTVEIKGDAYKLHRLAFLYMTGRWPPEEVDHINGVRHENRWLNLRPATRFENMQNRTKANKSSKTGLLGVKVLTYKGREYYRAAITVDGIRHYLGTFPTPQDAHGAYVEAKGRLQRPPAGASPC